jgi:hypothetical protein
LYNHYHRVKTHLQLINITLHYITSKEEVTREDTEVDGRTSLETSKHRNGLKEILVLQEEEEEEEEEEHPSERRVREIYVSGYTSGVLTACSDKLSAKYGLVPTTPEHVYLRMR